MRRLSSLAACLAALAFAGVAGADTPPDVYSDFAEDGSLSCGHSRAALKGVLTDASIHQYGDPLTFLGLKLAVRKQLAGSCRRAKPAAADEEPPVGGTAVPGDPDEPGAGGAKPPSEEEAEGRPPSTERPQEEEEQAVPLEVPSPGEDGRMTLLAVALLLLALGSGGWAARRAFTE
jgi:hypothetical protein